MNYNAPPSILGIKSDGAIVPYDTPSAHALNEFELGQVFTLKPRKGRNISRHSLYWVGLGVAVHNSDAWPTSEHLHNDLKRLCGYIEEYFNPLTGKPEIRVQSTSFAKMKEPEFKAYFELAQQKFISIMDFDPWSIS